MCFGAPSSSVIGTFAVADYLPFDGLKGIGCRIFPIARDCKICVWLIVGDISWVGGFEFVFPAAIALGHHVGLRRSGCPGLATDVGGDLAVVGKRDHDFCARGQRLGNHQEGVAVFYNDGVQCAGGRLAEVVELEVLRAALVAPGFGGQVEVAGVFDALELDALDGFVPRQIRADTETDGGQGVVELEGYDVGRAARSRVVERGGFGRHQVGLVGDVGRGLELHVGQAAGGGLYELLTRVRAVHIGINGVELEGCGRTAPTDGVDHLAVAVYFFIVEEVGTCRTVLAGKGAEVGVDRGLEPRAGLRRAFHRVDAGDGRLLQAHVGGAGFVEVDAAREVGFRVGGTRRKVGVGSILHVGYREAEIALAVVLLVFGDVFVGAGDGREARC